MLAQIAAPGLLEALLILAIAVSMIVLTVFPFWLIFTKAGFPGWYSLGMLFPILNLVLIFFLAFAKWPAIHGVPSARQGNDGASPFVAEQ
jgi:hypothetical protein